jgi:hypothetical protein
MALVARPLGVFEAPAVSTPTVRTETTSPFGAVATAPTAARTEAAAAASPFQRPASRAATATSSPFMRSSTRTSGRQ